MEQVIVMLALVQIFITSISATSRWKIAWGEQFKMFYTDKEIPREFVTFAPQRSQMCLNF